MQAGAEQAEDEDGDGEQEGAANLAAAFVGTGRCGWVRRRHGCLLGGFVDEVVDAEFEVGAVELAGERGELAYAGDGAPGGAIDGVVVGGAVEVHGSDVSVGEDGEANLGDTLFVERGAGFFRNEREPGVVDLADDFFEVGVEVDAHGVGEDVYAGLGALVCDGNVGSVVSALATILSGLLGGLADGIAGGLVLVAEVGLGRGRTRRIDGGLLGGLLRKRRRGRLLLLLGRGLLLLRWRGGLGGGCGGSRRTGATHGLKLLQGLAVEGGLDGLLSAILIADDVAGALLELFRHVFRHVEVGHLLVALLQDVGRIDEARLVEEDAGAIEEEPADSEVEDERDVNGLAEASLGAFIVEGVEQMNEFVFFEFAEAAGSHLEGRVGRGGVWRRLGRWHRLWV